MTAEIAILNKSAVALAADSAVSIGAPPNLKIYNTVNKTFELSTHMPIGIMVYGRLDYMGLPLETIIKQYRKNLGTTAFKTILDAKIDFCKYLLSDVPFHDEDVSHNIRMLIYGEFSKINRSIDELIFADIQARGAYQKSKVNTIAQTHISSMIEDLRRLPFADGFRRKVVPEKFKDAVNEMIDYCFSSIKSTDKTKKLIYQYAGYFLSKRTLSDYRTGIVIAGFGDNELCPSLAQFEIDGIVDGKLKIIDSPYIDISRRKLEADILGFAQDDMMKSFLNGVNPEIHKYFNLLISDAIKDTASMILRAMLNDDSREASALAQLQGTMDRLGADLTGKASEYISEKSAKPIRDMIISMPKQELATLASSLVEITSLKRKVTRVQETVGGDVDVAIISKAEGFVWTKRKHYFPAELNKRFFVRHFGEK